jgi:hypothetical protein
MEWSLKWQSCSRRCSNEESRRNTHLARLPLVSPIVKGCSKKHEETYPRVWLLHGNGREDHPGALSHRILIHMAPVALSSIPQCADLQTPWCNRLLLRATEEAIFHGNTSAPQQPDEAHYGIPWDGRLQSVISTPGHTKCGDPPYIFAKLPLTSSHCCSPNALESQSWRPYPIVNAVTGEVEEQAPWHWRKYRWLAQELCMYLRRKKYVDCQEAHPALA